MASVFTLLVLAPSPASAQSTSGPTAPELILSSTCLNGNGRVDINLVNRTRSLAIYRIELGNLSARQIAVKSGDWGRLRFTGRVDGPLPLRILRNGVEIRNEPVNINCDGNPPQVRTPEVQVVNSCRAGNGYIVFQFANRTASSKSWVIEFEGVRNRSTTAPAFGAALRSVSGRPDGVYSVVLRSGTERTPMTIAVDCDAPFGQSPPESVQTLRVVSANATSIEVTWDNPDDARRRSFEFFMNGVPVGSSDDPDATSFRFTRLTPGVTYELGVTALGDADEFNWARSHYSRRTNVAGTTTRT